MAKTKREMEDTFADAFRLAIRINLHERNGDTALSQRCQSQITDWQAYSAAQTVILQIILMNIERLGIDAVKLLEFIRDEPPHVVPS